MGLLSLAWSSRKCSSPARSVAEWRLTGTGTGPKPNAAFQIGRGMDPSYDTGSDATPVPARLENGWAFWEKLYLVTATRGAGFRGFRGGIPLASDFGQRCPAPPPS